MTTSLSSLFSQGENIVGDVAKIAEGTLNPLAGISGAVSDSAQAVKEGETIVATENAEHNTAAMVTAAEAAREEAEVEKDNEAEVKAEHGDESEDESRLS